GQAREEVHRGSGQGGPRARVLDLRGRPAAQGDEGRQVRRVGRGALPHRAERPPRRRAAARHRCASARAGQVGHDRRLREGPQGRRGRGRRRGHRRRRGPRREDPGRLHRLRRRHRDARHDAHRRPPGPHPRPAGQDAEPPRRHRHDGHRQGRRGVEGRQDRVPHGSHRERAPHDREDVLRRAVAHRQLHRDLRRDRPRQAVRREGQVHPVDHAHGHHGPGHQGRSVEDRGGAGSGV
ncbi:MAG: LSU ribosomal protein L1p (L10Ae), partial [uncultured Solirubrobacteraceae bacterium]